MQYYAPVLISLCSLVPFVSAHPWVNLWLTTRSSAAANHTHSNGSIFVNNGAPLPETGDAPNLLSRTIAWLENLTPETVEDLMEAMVRIEGKLRAGQTLCIDEYYSWRHTQKVVNDSLLTEYCTEFLNNANESSACCYARVGNSTLGFCTWKNLIDMKHISYSYSSCLDVPGLGFMPTSDRTTVYVDLLSDDLSCTPTDLQSLCSALVTDQFFLLSYSPALTSFVSVLRCGSYR